MVGGDGQVGPGRRVMPALALAGALVVLLVLPLGAAGNDERSNSGAERAASPEQARQAQKRPRNITRPKLTGNPRPGRRLTCEHGRWRPRPHHFTYAWLRDGVRFERRSPGTARYLVNAGDVGHEIGCKVRAWGLGGKSKFVAARPVLVQAVPDDELPPVVVSPPVLSGVGTAGSRLTCTLGVFTRKGNGRTLTILRDGVAVRSATGTKLQRLRYITSNAEIGAVFTCTDIRTSPFGPSELATSNAITLQPKPPPPPPVNLTPPVLSGTGVVGTVLKCTTGTWTDSGSYAFTWLRNGVPFPDPTPDSPQRVPVPAAAVGESVTCQVTRTHNGVTSLPATSNAIAITAAPTT